MTLYTVTDSALFAAAARFTSKEQTRPYLHGVYIEPAAGGGILLTATDGHRLFHGYDPKGAAPAPAIIVPEKAKLPAPWSKPAPITIDLTAGIMRHPDGGTMGARLDDGRFPRYNLVIPREFTGEVSHFNASYIGDLGDVTNILEKGAQPFIVHNGEDAALVLFGARRDCFGVLMPIRKYARINDTSKPELPKAAAA
jgi:DNA polymerase III sliding clamp (beta) subunit (PCNA family)